ncbi:MULTISPECIES: flavoprotein [Caballeronia]|uniref:Dihydromethanopterin reductase n=1 Tax=Caballeronia zhejiangensis TaxID=871203 RepID=A0A656QEH0_9BURK|nr:MULTISPECIES: flavoprotein [Caballeronia]EKS67421.1 flavoprotein [Burkholderia sp. SJ98]KDR25167.1 dihydromethanopterin reductase [Caballeronia zhejiangensis]MCG7405642.1 dihydromethanopterin reductase [Caballeronia zhejiangensis]MCI1047771.1 dihydromethanopterin reductase [Caballeronia zhejiangensis]MDR5789294.1 flavoprotein [Caballeronia sp. LP003]
MTQPTPARRLDEFKPDARFAWCVTGSGHMLEESIALARQLPGVDLFLSSAGEEVLPLYGWTVAKLREHFKVLRDNSASSVPVGMIYNGEYHTVVIAPATSNTVAKCAFGISDTLPTNLYAQAGKQCVPGIVFACDTAPSVITHAPHEWVEVRPRAIEFENVERLARFAHTTVARSLDDLKAALDQRLADLKLAWNTSSS